MALFDSVLSQINARFSLGDKSSALLDALLAFINRDGLTAFIDRFHRAGLTYVADSWVASGANASLSHTQLTDALGADAINQISAQAGISAETAIPALAAMIPRVVDEMTPDGVVRDSRGAAVETIGDRAAIAGTVATEPAIGTNAGNSLLRAILPLLLLAFLVGIGFWTCRRPNQETRLAQAPVVADSPNTARSNRNAAPAPTATINPRLSVRAENGKYFVSGVVSSEAERNQIIEAMRREFGDAALDFSGLRVDANAKPATWMARFGELLPSLKGWNGGELTLSGERDLRASGNIPQTAIDRAKSLFAGWNLPPIFIGTGAEAQRAANEQAAAALETATTPEQVVEALNLSIINFATGKSDVPADAGQILQKAAGVLKNAPTGTVIEVGGHTDNQGNSAANQKLSEARAASVRDQLVRLGVKAETLIAKGYGASKPKADNATEQGRFQNRRIEYTVTNSAANTPAAHTGNNAADTHSSGH